MVLQNHFRKVTKCGSATHSCSQSHSFPSPHYHPTALMHCSTSCASRSITAWHVPSSARVSHLMCPRVLKKHNPTQHTFGLTLPRLLCPPPYTPPHACRVVHVRAVPHPAPESAPPCASRSITAAWHVPLAHFTHPCPCIYCAPHFASRLAFLMLRFAPPQVLHTLFSPSCSRGARPYLFHTLCHRAPPGLSLHGTCLWLALVSIPPHGMSSLYQSSHTLTGALTHTALHRSIHFSHASPPLHHNPALNLLRPASCSRWSSHYGLPALRVASLSRRSLAQLKRYGGEWGTQ